MIPELFSRRDLMTPKLLGCFVWSALWLASKWIFSLVIAFCSNRAERRDADFVNMCLLGFGSKPQGDETGTPGDSTRCTRPESEKPREKIREGVRNRIYSRTIILPVISLHPSKEISILRNSAREMSQIPLITADDTVRREPPLCSKVILEAGIPGDTWRYCVERKRLAEKSEWFNAMLIGPLAPAPSDPPPLLKLEHVEKRAFDYLLRCLLDEPINFQSVSTARATLDVAHQCLCPELAQLSVEYLERNLNPSTVLEIYQGLSLYANNVTPGSNNWSLNIPSAPPAPGDDAGEIAAVCTRLLLACLDVIDSEPEAVLDQETFEELNSAEVEELACRDTLRLANESILFNALDRWAASECRRNGVEPSPVNKRSALEDDVWYSVRYPLMTDREFIEGPMASGILSSEESAFIVAKILGHSESQANEELRNSYSGALPKLSSAPRIGVTTYNGRNCRMSKLGKKECQENRKNRRKECANQGHRACTRIGNCLVRVLACIFD